MDHPLLPLIAGLLLLYLGGEGTVRGSASLGLRLGMTPLLTGLTIVALGTSAPELMVSLNAALQGQGDLAVGNVVGSNICNIGLILGLSTLFNPVRVEARLVRKDVPLMLLSSGVIVVMLLDSTVSRVEGGVLVTGLALFLAHTIRDSKRPRAAIRREFREALKGDHFSLPASLGLVALGIALLVVGGRLFVHGAVAASAAFGIAPAVIGLSVAAIGTSLPELATSVVAAVRGYGDMAAGNVVGSNIFNSLTVLGSAALVTPLESGGVTVVDLGVMLAFSALSLRLLSTRRTMERWEGGALLAGFALYLAWLFT